MTMVRSMCRIILISLLVSSMAGAAAQAGDYPARPIKIISPFSAGAAPDALVRLIGQELSERLGQSVTIENRPGGATTTATRTAALADPDGYTLVQVNSALAYATVLYPNAGYDPLKSFSPVAAFADWSHLLVVSATIPSRSISELIAYAKSNPVNIGFPLGSPPQVLAEVFKSASGAPFNSIPYRQNSQLMADLLAGRIQAFFGAGSSLLSFVKVRATPGARLHRLEALSGSS